MTAAPVFRFWPVALAAAAILMITNGVRTSFGLFIAPIDAATGIGIADISLALAFAQLTWGAVQPVAGAFSDRYGAARVLVTGCFLLIGGVALAPLLPSAFGLILTIGILASLGAGIGSFSVLLGAAAHQLPPNRQGLASGFINAGSSFGQFLFAPLAQALITLLGWRGAMWSMALIGLAVLPLIRVLGGSTPHQSQPSPPGGLKRAVVEALADRSYLLLHAGFFTCGFHIAFLVTHLPTEVDLCGLPASVASWSLALIGLSNIVGSLWVGHLVGHHRSKMILALMYGSRALLVLVYLLLPREPWVFYLFAIGLGLTWLATVPPTAALVGKLFGVRYLGTLFGMTLLSHQIGGFLGAWLGGLAITQLGDYTWMWWADIALAALAALLNLPIREARVVPLAASAAEGR